MTRTISLIIGIAVVALGAVPTALGAYGLGDTPGARTTEPDAVQFFYENERATLAAQSTGLVSRPDSHELAPANGSVVSRPDSHEGWVAVPKFGYIDAAERADRIRSMPTNDVVLLSGDDKSTFGRPIEAPVPVASSGTDYDWPQLGIGFGIGIALALGLVLTLRATRNRPLAH